MFFEPSDNVVLVDRDAFDEFRRRRVLKGDKLLPGLRRFQEFRCLELTSAIVDARLLAEMRDAGLQPRPLGFLSFPPVYPPDERDEKGVWGGSLRPSGSPN